VPAPAPIAPPGGAAPCDGPYRDGIRPGAAELSRILEEHEVWVRTGRGRRANLCGADVRGADLSGANLARALLSMADLSEGHLFKADLTGAELVRARLRGTDLIEARLDGADLRRADLAGANLLRARLAGANLADAELEPGARAVVLVEAVLTDANLRRASLPGAQLTQADLKGANLYGADLRHANLLDARLTGADLRDSDVAGAVLELEPGALPGIQALALARHLAEVTYVNTPATLVELRGQFKDRGLRSQERALTYAIRSTETAARWREGGLGAVESAFNWLLFDLTSAYGMAPGRPLRLLVLVILSFTPVYLAGLGRRGRAGIWIVPLPDRLHKRKDITRPQRVGRQLSRFGKRPVRGVRAVARMLWIALCFSVLSAFQLGWRDFNVGSWIARLQPREYSLRASGWVRTVAAAESLISVYLMALWALTYFGRPFE
jgi:uncharacterized protein YjbI with pentapeptide repeats